MILFSSIVSSRKLKINKKKDLFLLDLYDFDCVEYYFIIFRKYLSVSLPVTLPYVKKLNQISDYVRR